MTRSSAPAEGEATIKEQTAARIDSDNHDRCYLKSLGVSVGIVLVTEGALTARMAKHANRQITHWLNSGSNIDEEEDED
jgi:hypothetical protein